MEKLDVSRWRQASRIYIVAMDTFQLGLARRLDVVPHYQVETKVLQTFIRDLVGSTSFDQGKLVIVGRASKYIDDDFCLVNLPVDIFCSDWKAVLGLLDSLSTKTMEGEKRHRVYADVGFASGVSTSRLNGCPWGIARPNLKSLTRLPAGKAVMANSSAISKAIDSHFPGVLQPPDKRCQIDFLSQHGGTFASARVAKTDGRALCGAHCDSENGNTQVIWAAKIVDRERIVQVCYNRKSIHEYYARLDRRLPYLTRFREAIFRIPAQRFSLSPHTLLPENNASKISRELSYGLSLAEIPCNMEVTAFYQPFLSVLYRLQSRFQLDFQGTCSVLCAMAVYSYSSLYPLVASQILIEKFGTDLTSAFTGKDIGYTLLLIMDLLEKGDLLDAHGRKFRFTRYRKVHALRREAEWKEGIQKLSSTWLVALGKNSSVMTQPDYNALVSTVVSNLPQVGCLKANHAVGMAACSGLVPLSALYMNKGGADKLYSKVKSQYSEQSISAPDKDSVLKDLRGLLQVSAAAPTSTQLVPNTCHLSQRYVENVACKIGRQLSGTDSQFVDIIHLDFPLLSVRVVSRKNPSLVLLAPDPATVVEAMPVPPHVPAATRPEIRNPPCIPSSL